MTKMRCVLFFVLACVVAPSAQIRDFDWYPSFRQWVQTAVPPGQRQPDAVAKLYAAKLKGEEVPSAEIQRRLALLKTRRADFENDFWNRFFTIDKPTFNSEPNAFLVSVVEGRKPGAALDVGMGEGRNALYLAKLGWQVSGIDPADQAVALSQERAAALNLKLDTHVIEDTRFDFGRERWDLILYSWVIPTASASQAMESLRPGGILVFEGRRDWFAPNGLLKLFDALRVVHYQDRVLPSDFFNRQEMPIVRFVAEKPLAP